TDSTCVRDHEGEPCLRQLFRNVPGSRRDPTKRSAFRWARRLNLTSSSYDFLDAGLASQSRGNASILQRRKEVRIRSCRRDRRPRPRVLRDGLLRPATNRWVLGFGGELYSGGPLLPVDVRAHDPEPTVFVRRPSRWAHHEQDWRKRVGLANDFRSAGDARDFMEVLLLRHPVLPPAPPAFPASPEQSENGIQSRGDESTPP